MARSGLGPRPVGLTRCGRAPFGCTAAAPLGGRAPFGHHAIATAFFGCNERLVDAHKEALQIFALEKITDTDADRDRNFLAVKFSVDTLHAVADTLGDAGGVLECGVGQDYQKLFIAVAPGVVGHAQGVGEHLRHGL